jgi:hypothetical protein
MVLNQGPQGVVNVLDNICKCVGPLLLLCLECFLFFFCFVGLLRKSRAYRSSSSSTGSFLSSSSFNCSCSSVICFEVLVVLLEFEVIVVQISGSRACSSRAIANVSCVVVAQEDILNLNQPGWIVLLASQRLDGAIRSSRGHRNRHIRSRF